MDNIISFQDKKKINAVKEDEERLITKEGLLKIVDEMRTLISEDKMTGLVAIGLGDENKIFSVASGTFDIILAIGGLETVKYSLLTHTELDEND